jgi:hypothetical protein
MDMFKPDLSLAREPDGEFTLHAVTLTPNSCFSSGFASDGAPPGYSTIPEARDWRRTGIVKSRIFCIRRNSAGSIQV